MVYINEIEFCDTIKVLFKLKEKKGHRTLQDTLKYLDTDDIEVMLDVLLVSYNAAHPNEQLNDDQLGDLLGEHNIGLGKLGFIYAEIVEKLTMSGMTEEETASLKNTIANLKK